MKTIYSALAIILLSLLFACKSSKHFLVKEQVSTKSGIVKGEYKEESGVTVFRGVPFAAPPVGVLRWKAPQPVKSWEGIKECVQFSPSPIQRTPEPFSMWTQEYIAPKEPLSEDCLYLNIWTGAGKPDEKRPVMVYIYGGGFNSGSGAVPIYDGEEMAKKGVVFITINYRVGLLGFLAHPELTDEAEYNASGNYGILDQIAALKWVNSNVSAFGGDPNNVTIAGQSAGAFSVNYLMASPLTKGLFHKAIAESGGAFLPTNRFSKSKSLEDAEQEGLDFAEKLSAVSINELREISAEDILAAGGFAAPIIDGYVLPSAPLDVFTQGKQNDVPLILGWNKDESNINGTFQTVDDFKNTLNAKYGEGAETLHDFISLNTDEDARALQVKLYSLEIFGLQIYKWMKLQNETGNYNVYLYNFEREVPFAEGMLDYGAFHSSEIPYAYNNLHKSNRPWQDADYELADAMSDYWVQFAKTGDPNSEGLTNWSACSPEETNAIIFDKDLVCKELPDLKLLNFLEDFYSNN